MMVMESEIGVGDDDESVMRMSKCVVHIFDIFDYILPYLTYI
jgi:hypothetical protein